MKNISSVIFIFLFLINYSQIRDDITYLNGEWEIIYDYNNIGKSESYNTSEGFSKGTIENISVPSVWERFKKDYEGVVYYRTSFKVNKDKIGSKIHLNFNASNYITEVFLNDNSVGFHEGGFSPFSFNIEHIIDFDTENILIVKVMGPITIQDKVIDGIGHAMYGDLSFKKGVPQSVNYDKYRLIRMDETPEIKAYFVESNLSRNQYIFEILLLPFSYFFHLEKPRPVYQSKSHLFC